MTTLACRKCGKYDYLATLIQTATRQDQAVADLWLDRKYKMAKSANVLYPFSLPILYHAYMSAIQCCEYVLRNGPPPTAEEAWQTKLRHIAEAKVAAKLVLQGRLEAIDGLDV